MTSSSAGRKLALLFTLLVAPLAWAGLGDAESSINGERLRLRAFHSTQRAPQYAMHELMLQDGSRVRQFVGSSGRVFAVSWNSLSKPDLSALLGNAFAGYAGAVQVAGRRGGIQRQFRHEEADLVVQTSGHLHVYAGYAYRRSLLPPGLDLQAIGLG